MRERLKSWDGCLRRHSGVWVILGHRGEGKSSLAWWLAEKKHGCKKQIISYGAPRVTRRMLPRWVKHVEDIPELVKVKKPSVIIVDEAALRVAARRHQAMTNLLWGQMVAVSRHKQHLLIFVAQHGRQIDINLIGDSDLTIYKKPSELHTMFARPELKADVLEAFELLGDKGKDSMKWAMVHDYATGAKGMLKNGLPEFWSEELSRSFALVELEAGPSNGIGKKVAQRCYSCSHQWERQAKLSKCPKCKSDNIRVVSRNEV